MPIDVAGWFCSLGELARPGPGFFDFNRKHCGYPGREKYAMFWAIIGIVVLMVIFILTYALIPHDDYHQSPPAGSGDVDMHAIDWVTAVGTIVILFVAYFHFCIFYVGRIPPFPTNFNKYASRSHVSEAFLEYTFFYGMGMGVLGPAIKELAAQDGEYRYDLFPYYPLVFLSLMLGFYIFQWIKFAVKGKK